MTAKRRHRAIEKARKRATVWELRWEEYRNYNSDSTPYRARFKSEKLAVEWAKENIGCPSTVSLREITL